MIAIYVKPTGADCSVHADYGKPRPMEVTIFTGVKDDTIVEFAFAEAGSAKDWPWVTLGEIRGWLKEKAAPPLTATAILDKLASLRYSGTGVRAWDQGATLHDPTGEWVRVEDLQRVLVPVEASADLPPTATDAAAPGSLIRDPNACAVCGGVHIGNLGKDACPTPPSPAPTAEPTRHGLMDDGLAVTGGPEYRAQPREPLADAPAPCGHYVVTAGCPDCTRVELAKHAARVTASGVAVEGVTAPVTPPVEPVRIGPSSSNPDEEPHDAVDQF